MPWRLIPSCGSGGARYSRIVRKRPRSVLLAGWRGRGIPTGKAANDCQDALHGKLFLLAWGLLHHALLIEVQNPVQQ